MNTRRYLPGFLLACALGFALQGCVSTMESRIREKSAVYGQLNAATQQHIRKGLIENGYTKDMVYMALGAASEMKTADTPDGSVDIWTYKNMALARKTGFKGVVYNTNFDIAPGAPGSRPGTGMSKQAFSSLDMTQIESATELPDLPMGTLNVYFYQGRVYKMALKL